MLRDLIKARTTAGLRRAVNDLAREFRIQKLHRAALKQVHRFSGSDLKLHLGCGRNRKEGWVNIDLSDEADLQLDLREPLPFAENAASTIYSEHFFEHLEYPDQAVNFLASSMRILRPGGLFCVGVPDTEGPLKSYANGDEGYFLDVREHWHPDWCNTRMHNLNYHFRQKGQHKYAYDYETLARVLEEAGFVSITRRPYNPGLDDARRGPGTIYVDARKPGSTPMSETSARAA